MYPNYFLVWAKQNRYYGAEYWLISSNTLAFCVSRPRLCKKYAACAPTKTLLNITFLAWLGVRLSQGIHGEWSIISKTFCLDYLDMQRLKRVLMSKAHEMITKKTCASNISTWNKLKMCYNINVLSWLEETWTFNDGDCRPRFGEPHYKVRQSWDLMI